MLHQLVCQLSPSSLRRLLLSFGRASDSEYEKAPHNIDGSVMDVLATLGDFKNMIIFLEHFGLDKVLEGKGTKKGKKGITEYHDYPYRMSKWFPIQDT